MVRGEVERHLGEELIGAGISPYLTEEFFRMSVEIVADEVDMPCIRVLFHTVFPEEIGGIFGGSAFSHSHHARANKRSHCHKDVPPPVALILIIEFSGF